MSGLDSHETLVLGMALIVVLGLSLAASFVLGFFLFSITRELGLLRQALHMVTTSFGGRVPSRVGVGQERDLEMVSPYLYHTR